MTAAANPDDASLAQAIRHAHASGSAARISRLYENAADLEVQVGHIDAACFFLTQAWVFALDAGLDDADRLEARLRRHGRV